ncbi:hypothetical protein F5Y04DRAFT_111917 [Hypomontagnella monticulosa]|nr:hypothetical protein F5Y04DRAFT_111917 [Hypomontagnella monticulosa]
MKMDWLVSLQTFGTSYLYPALKLILKLCYIVTIPLHYPIYYLLALVVFLLSPIWYILHSIWRVALAVVGLVTKLKYLYIYLACAAIIGICAGFILRGTSSFIFVSLGIDPTSQKVKEYDQRTKLPPTDDDQDFYEPESGTRSEDSSSRLSIPGMSSRRARIKRETKDDAYEMFEKQWKLLRSTEKPRRRRRGLLSQTIHEESSSDLS